MGTSYAWLLGSPQYLIPYAFFFVLAFLLSRIEHRPWAIALFFFLITIFVGFRFETGFDWPVYKSIYFALSIDPSIDGILACQTRFNQEPAFIWLLSLFARTGVDYEVAQASFALILGVSIFTLGRVFDVRPILAIVLSLCFLMPSLAFSTMRQSLAISFFNFALAFLINRKFLISTILLIVSVAFQVTAAIYVIAALTVVCLSLLKIDQFRLRYFLALSIGVLLITFLGVFFGQKFSHLLPQKIAFYMGSPQIGKVHIWMVIMLVLPLAMGFHATLGHSNGSIKLSFLRNIIVVLAAFSVGTAIFSIASERSFYALWIFYSMYACSVHLQRRMAYIAATACIGLILTFLTIGRYPNNLAFFPYQNYAQVKWTEVTVDSERRAKIFLNEFQKLSGYPSAREPANAVPPDISSSIVLNPETRTTPQSPRC